MFSKRGHCVVVSLVCLLQHILNCVGQDGVYLNITRQKDGDMFTRHVASNISSHSCDRWHAVKVSPYSKENCTARCKCKRKYETYSIRMGRCASEKDILNFENCTGTFLPSFGKPLYDLSKPGKAELQVSFLNNQSYSCRNSTVRYFNGTNEINFTNTETRFNISADVNGRAFLTWKPQNLSLLSEIPEYGYLLKVRLLCSAITSQPQRSCFIIKTQGRLVKKIEPTLKEQRWIHDRCSVQKPTKSTNVMLLYILVGVGCACVLIVVAVACYACYTRRRRLSRRAIPNTSRTSASSRKASKTRTGLTKNNGPTTPAIHDVIFNQLSWYGDGGFSNRALADPTRVLEVDYGIPIDFGTLPRPESTTSIDSNRNSLSPLTDITETAQHR